MDAATIKTFIDTMGFPIFVCLCLMWYIRGTLSKHSELLSKHSELMTEIQRSLSANTETIKLLVQKLEGK